MTQKTINVGPMTFTFEETTPVVIPVVEEIVPETEEEDISNDRS